MQYLLRSNERSSSRAIHFSSVQSLSRVRLFATPWTAARQTSLSIINSPSLLMSIKFVMPSSHLILCCPLLLLLSIFSSIRVFSNKSALHIRWPKYWNFSISPCNDYSGLISLRMDWLDLLAVQGTLQSSPESSNFMAEVNICSDFGAKKKSLRLFPLFPHLFATK